MSKTKVYRTIEYTVYEAVKKEMSQQFDDDGKVVPYTALMLNGEKDSDALFDNELGTKVLVVGNSKGKGFAGTVKKWGFRAGPNTHGQIKRRSSGSIGTQGQGRVIPGKKMAGRMGNQKITIRSKVVGIDKLSKTLRVSGSVPGSKGSKVYIYIKKNED